MLSYGIWSVTAAVQSCAPRVVFLQHQQETGPKPNQPVLMAVLNSILTAYIQKTQDLIDENGNALIFSLCFAKLATFRIMFLSSGCVALCFNDPFPFQNATLSKSSNCSRGWCMDFYGRILWAIFEPIAQSCFMIFENVKSNTFTGYYPENYAF